MNFVVSHSELLRLRYFVEALAQRVEALCTVHLDVLAQAAGLDLDNSRASEGDAR
jgi:hypothetical protein